jgi:hypothetical protein
MLKMMNKPMAEPSEICTCRGRERGWTELPTLAAAADSIDPEILVQAFDNDALERAQPRPLAATLRPRLRRLVPDTQLLNRRAAGESLRILASDYDVSHSTLVRFFARPGIKRQPRQTVQELRAKRRARPARSLSRGNPSRRGSYTSDPRRAGAQRPDHEDATEGEIARKVNQQHLVVH